MQRRDPKSDDPTVINTTELGMRNGEHGQAHRKDGFSAHIDASRKVVPQPNIYNDGNPYSGFEEHDNGRPNDMKIEE